MLGRSCITAGRTGRRRRAGRRTRFSPFGGAQPPTCSRWGAAGPCCAARVEGLRDVINGSPLGNSEARSTRARWTMLRTFRLIDAAALSAVGLWVAACAESSAPTAPKDQFRTELITCQAFVNTRTLSCGTATPVRASDMSFDVILGGQGLYVQLISSGTA